MNNFFKKIYQKFYRKNIVLTRSDIINSYIKKYNYTSYLEIGVNTPAQPGYNWDNIIVKKKHGVDPAPETKATFLVTSDEFFDTHITEKYDIIFIDGLHLFEQVYKDITHSLKWLNQNGTIIVHDCNPIKEITQRRERASDTWHGDVWKAILKLRTEDSNIEIFTVDTDEGCTVIRRGYQELYTENPRNEDRYTYRFFNKYRKNILNLVTVEEFIKKMKK